MAQLLTATIGTLLWMMAQWVVDTRLTMGRGWPWVHVAVWGVAWAVARLGCERRRRPWRHGRAALEAGPGLRAQLRAAGVDVLLFLAAAALASFGLGAVFGVLHVGNGAGSVWGITLLLALVLSVPAWLGLGVARWAVGRGHALPAKEARPVEEPSGLALALALAPLLALPLVLLLLQSVPLPAPWSALGTPSSRAGVMAYAQLTGLLPCALIVAWGLDRLDGSRGDWPGRTVVAGACLAFVGLGLWLPDALLEHGSRHWMLGRSTASEASTWKRLLWPLGRQLRGWAPFAIGSRTGGEVHLEPLPIEALTRAGLALLWASAGAAALALRRLGQGARPATGRLLGALLLGALITLGGASRFGPTQGPAALTWVALLGVAVSAWPWCAARPPAPPT